MNNYGTFPLWLPRYHWRFTCPVTSCRGGQCLWELDLPVRLKLQCLFPAVALSCVWQGAELQPFLALWPLAVKPCKPTLARAATGPASGIFWVQCCYNSGESCTVITEKCPSEMKCHHLLHLERSSPLTPTPKRVSHNFSSRDAEKSRYEL